MTAPAVGAAVRRGLSHGAKNLHITAWMYVFSLFAALPAGLCAGALVHGYFGDSLASEVFAAGLDVGLAVELVMKRSAALQLLPAVLLGSLSSWVLLSAIVNGALLYAVSCDAQPMTSELFSGAGRAFGRLIRLFFLGVPFVLVPVGLVAAGASWLAAEVSEDWTSERGVLVLRLAALALTAAAALWLKGVYDLMKVIAVVKGERRARYAFLDGVKLGLRHPLRTVILHLPFALLVFGLTFAFSLADVEWTRGSWWAIGLGIAFQQAVALVRAWVHVSLAAAEVVFVRSAGRSRAPSAPRAR